jgi:hypothetical protein
MVDYPFFDGGKAAAFSYFLILAIAAPINLILFYSVIREPSTRQSMIDQANLVVITGTLVWAILSIIIILRAYLAGGYDIAGCNAIGFTVGLTAITEIAGQGLMAFDRFMVVVLEKKMTKKQFYSILLGTLSIPLVCNLIQLHPDFGFYPMDGSSWCFFPLWTTVPHLKATGVIIMTICLLCLVGVALSYYMIFKKVGVIKNKLNETVSVKTKKASSNADRRKQNVERALFIRCLSIVISFVICFGLEFIIFFYEAVSNSRVTPRLGQVASAMGSSDAIINPILAITFNKYYKRAIMKHVFGVRHSTSQRETISESKKTEK